VLFIDLFGLFFLIFKLTIIPLIRSVKGRFVATNDQVMALNEPTNMYRRLEELEERFGRIEQAIAESPTFIQVPL